MSRVTDQGLPRSVSTSAQLPSNAYNGAICVVESGDGAGAYVYVGSEWTQLASATEEGSGEQSGDLVAKSYALSTNFPANPTKGTIVLSEASGLINWYDGSAWKEGSVNKTSVEAPTYGAVSALPNTASGGSIAYVSGESALYFHNGTAWKKITSAT